MTGLVFDIQKFSLHDGPGIRTTVFLKGCPLFCVWCANPESQSLQPQLGYMAQKCRHCMNCVAVCPTGAHQQYDDTHTLDFDLCTHCGECVAVCPHNALKMVGEIMSVQEIIERVVQDRLYYEKSGGGMTLSGGEPTYQFEFAKALLQAAKAENIHTCLETAGYVATDKLKQLLPLVDCFLFDFKVFDDNLMQKFTGVSNTIILHNLKMLNEKGATIILRCPIIPGINDSTDHFSKSAELARTMHNIKKIQVMPYHDFGRCKAHEIGKAYSLTEKAANPEMVDHWITQLRQLGCPHVEQG